MEERKGKKLLRSCMNQLSKITKTDNGSNEALYPVVIIFLGHKTVSHFSANVIDLKFIRDVKIL